MRGMIGVACAVAHRGCRMLPERLARLVAARSAHEGKSRVPRRQRYGSWPRLVPAASTGAGLGRSTADGEHQRHRADRRRVATCTTGRTRAGHACAAVRADRRARPTCCVLCGDLTDYGLPEEAQVLARELTAVVRSRSSPCWATTTSSPAAGRGRARSSRDAGVSVLDGDAVRDPRRRLRRREGVRAAASGAGTLGPGASGDQGVRPGGASTRR